MKIGVPGMSVTKVHGYGDYRNFYTKGSMTDLARIEVFIEIPQAGKSLQRLPEKYIKV